MADNQYQDYNNAMNNEQYAQDVQQAGYDNQAYDGQYVDNQNYDYGQAYDNKGNYDNSQPFDAQQYQEQVYDNSQNAFYTQNTRCCFSGKLNYIIYRAQSQTTSQFL